MHTIHRVALLPSALIVLVAASVSSPVRARALSFDERVAAQKAIEQVYWNHRVWPKENTGPKPALSAAMPDEAIRAKVEDYLKKSNALETWWQRPITADQLQAEVDRMAKHTRDGATLQELFRALGNDPFAIAETLARQTLSERQIRSWYSSDTRFHGDSKAKAGAALAACASTDCMKSMGGEYRETTWTRRAEHADPTPDVAHESAVRLDADAWDSHLAGLVVMLGGRADALPKGSLSRVDETPEAFVITAVLAQREGAVTTASVAWPKRSFDAWWDAERGDVGSGIKQSSGTFTLPNVPSTACTNDTWNPTRFEGPDGASVHTAVWTGTEMIVWGGNHSLTLNDNTGGRYNPSTDTWTATSVGANVPAGRTGHTAVWTGTEMIVWGGILSLTLNDNTGGRYNPNTDTWTRTSVNAPERRAGHTAVWTGTEMLIWGGVDGAAYLNTGGRYKPSTDTWTATSTGTNVPAARSGHAGVWTGTKLIVWGGEATDEANVHFFLNSGGRYDPVTDVWSPTSVTAVPDERSQHTAVWTGTKMIVWGGSTGPGSPRLNTGGQYAPATDTWTPTSNTATPAARNLHTAVWADTEMIVWGGGTFSDDSVVETGGRYNPSTDTWTTTSTTSVPERRFLHTAVWTGTEMIIWGGVHHCCSSYLSTGGRYKPATDTWTPTLSGTSVPFERYDHTAVWTGTEMIVWGGDSPGINSGGRYNPSIDAWTATSMGANVPTARFFHTAVWTGTEMIVWGGRSTSYLNTGGRYNPSADTWLPMSMTTVPTERMRHSVVWTGAEMLVWGGYGPPSGLLNSGGRYNPSTDLWTPTSLTNVPAARVSHSAVWAGTEMIVWGGTDDDIIYFNSGGRYKPSTDTWTATSTGLDVPGERSHHNAVWTGTKMVIWGGLRNGPNWNTGGRYDPSTDSWMATSTGVDVPAGRLLSTAVWTGTEMIVWGGEAGATLKTGGRYNPSTDTWSPTSTTNVPAERSRHTAVWTGTEMIVWGGFPLSRSGGRYCACPDGRIYYRDADGDGFGNGGLANPACLGGPVPTGYVADSTDCNDANASIHPGAAEVCDGADDNCDGTVDNGAPCDDNSVCTTDACTGATGCGHTPLADGTGCDDANTCTLSETCRSGSCLAPVSFSQPAGSPVTVGTSPRSLAVGDWNGDGKLDLAVANNNSGNVTILLGNGLGGFTQAAGSPITVGSLPRAVAVGDWNGDLKPDLAVANQGSANLSILLGTGTTGGFTLGTPVTVGTTPFSIAVGDWNGDLKLDLAVANNGNANVSILLGTGTGGFTAGSPVGVGSGPNSVADGDWDRDGKLDLAVANNGSDNLTILRGDGSGGFTAIGSAIPVGDGPFCVAAGDWNGDGTLDLVVANSNVDNVTILVGDGTLGFSAFGPPVAAGDAPFSIAVGDVNGDGDLDLAVANGNSNDVTMLLGNGSSGFTSTGAALPVGTTPRGIALGKLDAGGKPDFAVANGGSASHDITILLNVTTSAADGTLCSDGNACTANDVCESGACAGMAITVPAETRNLKANNKTTFVWDAAAFATRYDVLRGRMGALPVGPGDGDETCFDDRSGTTLVDSSLLAPDAGYWYLSRGENSCGIGTYGTRSNGSPRTTSTCP